MGKLKDFAGYIKERQKKLASIEKRLCSLQEKYEQYFQEVSRVRETELAQLTALILAGRDTLPPELNQALDRASEEQQRRLDLKLKQLRSERTALLKKADQTRQLSAKNEQAVRRRNADLDREEEDLKERNTKLLRQVEEYNRRIREMSRGFGFFANLFSMRKLAAERQVLDRELSDVAARIEALRLAWQKAEQEHIVEEERLQRQWVEQQTEAAAQNAKIEHLEATAPEILLRSTLEQVLFERAPALPAPGPTDPPCPRCEARNPPAAHFCQICAKRLGTDRPDLAGSLLEIAELNAHHQRFAEGMRACQEIIGLVRGLSAGLAAFLKSVEDVQESERKYPLPKLEIELPEPSVTYGRSFDALDEVIRTDLSLHPKIFAERVNPFVTQTFTEANIQSYFKGMGDELSRQATLQW